MANHKRARLKISGSRSDGVMNQNVTFLDQHINMYGGGREKVTRVIVSNLSHRTALENVMKGINFRPLNVFSQVLQLLLLIKISHVIIHMAPK